MYGFKKHIEVCVRVARVREQRQAVLELLAAMARSPVLPHPRHPQLKLELED